MKRGLCSAILVFEAIVLLMGMFVIGAPAGWVALTCVVTVGLLGRPWGFAVGHLVQVAMIALGVLALPMLFMGIVFAGLWMTAYVLGLRIDRDRADRARAIG